MDFKYSMSSQRCASVSSGPTTPFPRGPLSKEWPALEFPGSDVSYSKHPLFPLVSNPTLTGSNSRPMQNFFERCFAGSSISYRFGTEPLCRYGGVAQTPSRGAALYTPTAAGGRGNVRYPCRAGDCASVGGSFASAVLRICPVKLA